MQPIIKSDQTIEIFGHILYISPGYLTIKGPETGRCYLCEVNYKVPVRIGDIFYGLSETSKVRSIPTGTLIMAQNDGFIYPIVRDPLIKIAYTREIIINVLAAAVKSEEIGTKLYLYLISQVLDSQKGPKAVSDLLDSLCTQKGYTLPSLGPKRTYYVVKHWKIERLYRQVELWGLDKKQIKDFCYLSHCTVTELHNYCNDLPSAIFTIELDQLNSLKERKGLTLNDNDKVCYQTVRAIYLAFKQGKISIKLDLPITMQTILEKQYPVACLNGNWYLKYPALILNYLRSCYIKLAKVKINNTDLPNEIELPDVNQESGVLKLTTDQINAIHMALSNGASLVTGAAGTGKTTLLRGLVQQLKRLKLRYFLTSYTGKAVARMRQVLGSDEPMTLDYLIVVTSKPKSLKGDILVIDEISMVSLELLFRTLRLFVDLPRLIMIGDHNQLLPISWGPLLACVLASNIPVYKLNHVHRCHDALLTNPYRIINGEELVQTDSCSLIPGNSVMLIYNKLLAAEWDPASITILTPYREDMNQFNQQVAEKFYGPNCPEFCLGDRVIVKENQNRLNIFNGQEFTIDKVDKDNVYFTNGDKQIALAKDRSLAKKNYKNDINKATDEEGFKDPPLTIELIDRAYSLSIHRCQGSEWSLVILYIRYHPRNPQMINRRLLYTAATRAKCVMFICGDYNEINEGIKRNPIDHLELLTE